MKRKTENQKTRRQPGRISLKNLMLENQPVDAEGNKIPFQTVQSQVYPIRLLRLSYEMENYFLNNAWSVAAGNDDIMGIGLFVEPYMFDPAVKDYSQYVGPNEAASHTAQSYGAYETYGQNDFYQGAVRTQQPYFTNPYVDQGVTMVTASYPVVRQGVTQCVIVVDINEDNFAKVRSSHPKYDTMYANIFTNDSTLVFDSEDKTYVGRKLSEMMGGQFGDIQTGMSQSQPFTVVTRKADTNLDVVRYFYPVQAGAETW